MQKLQERDVILKVVAGSKAYGTDTPDSDDDFRGIFIPAKDMFLGSLAFKEQFETKAPDSVMYDIRKYLSLAADSNPNVIEVIAVADEHVVSTTKYGEKLRSNLNLFLSKQCKFSYAGYARAQIHKVKTHRGWLLNPPKKKPERSDYGLPEHKRLVPKDWIDTLAQSDYTSEDVELIRASASLIELAKKEKAYKDAARHWDSYIHWKGERNPKRAALEAKFGYDTKHLHHCIRLQLQCCEILEGKGLIVYRPDREYLKDIRAGKFSYEELEWETERLTKRAEELYLTSTLPERADVEKVHALCVELVSEKLADDYVASDDYIKAVI